MINRVHLINRIHCYIAWSLVAVALAAAIATFALSLNHPISADLAMLHYSAWLINEKSFVLYRDIFDVNFPATFLFHSGLGHLLGYEALPLRFVDLCLVLLLGAASWKILSPISRSAAVLAPCVFIQLYLINGGEFTLERDVLCLLPAAAAFIFATSGFNTSNTRPLSWETALAGLFAAIACSMKPNAVVIVPALLLCIWQRGAKKDTKDQLNPVAIFLISMMIISSLPFLWVLKNGGIQDFTNIYKSFVPIYTNSRYDLYHYDSTTEKLHTLLKNYVMYGGGAILLSLPGLIWAWLMKSGDSIARQRIMQIAAMAFSFTVYEVIAGKFWLNHMFPSGYWTILCIALLLTSPAENASYRKSILAIFLLVPVIFTGYSLANISIMQMQSAHNKEKHSPQSWRARQVANFLVGQKTQPTDTVQMLDMAGDGQAALLMARATSATRHLIDVPLFMEPESPATQALRKEFIQDLEAKKPQFIVYMEQFLHPGGGNRLWEFKALASMIEQDYEIAEQREGGYIIFRRKISSEQAK